MTEKKIPTVRIGEQRVPAHRLWNVVESINTATDMVERFNEQRAELSTPMTRDVVGKVRARIRDMDLAMGGEGALKAAAKAAGIDVEDEKVRHGSTELAEEESGRRLVSDEDLAEAAKQLLSAMSVEEALNMLHADYSNPLDAHGLIALVGRECYVDAMSREAAEFAANMIAADQIAELWNESGYPPPNGGIWTVGEVQRLLDS